MLEREEPGAEAGGFYGLSSSMVDSTDYHIIEVEPAYAGPKLKGESITKDFVMAMLEAFSRGTYIHKRYTCQILLTTLDLLRPMPSLVDVDIPDGGRFTVCGDMHGQVLSNLLRNTKDDLISLLKLYDDLLRIFKLNGVPSEQNPYLFNGNFVDKGSFSVEVILTLFAFKCLYPKAMYLARGNHESRIMNKTHGFEDEVRSKLGEQFVELFAKVFCCLPLAHVINEKVFVVHGGLPGIDGVKLSQIKSINRFTEPPKEGLMCELLWSDPQHHFGRGPSKNGVAHSFGADVTKQFLLENNLDLVVRSNDAKHEGYEIEHDGKLITVFSAPNYGNQMGNKGAFLQFTAPELRPVAVPFSAAHHADGNNKPAPHYLSNEKETWMASSTAYSVFSVRVRLGHTVEINEQRARTAEKAYKKLVDGKGRSKRRKPSEGSPKQHPIYTTGFVVGEKDGWLRILTSAQGIKEIIPLRSKSLAEVDELNLAFRFQVVCLHLAEQHKHEDKHYMDASLLYLDSTKDLILLEAYVKGECRMEHPMIEIAKSAGKPSDTVFIHGWPVNCEGSFAAGRVSNNDRAYKDLECPNRFSYDMKLLEIFGACCSEGFAGGPVIDTDQRCLGAYHISSNHYGYAISWEHILDTLASFGTKEFHMEI
ncbi:hypothetical protein ACP70R_041344 [Stipagrostis hirtigluma subsp. patula]